MAHKTGAAFADQGAHIIHGAANAMYLPKVIAFNAKDPKTEKRFEEVADQLSIPGATRAQKVNNLIADLRRLNDALQIPHGIKTYCEDSLPTETGFVPENVFLERVHDIAVQAVADACTSFNPREISVEQMEKMLKAVYYDTEVDF